MRQHREVPGGRSTADSRIGEQTRDTKTPSGTWKDALERGDGYPITATAHSLNRERAAALNLRVKRGLPARLATLAAAAATTTVSTTAAARRTRTRFVHVQRAAVQFGAVEARDGRFGFIGVGHFHEGKATRLAGGAVGNDTDAFHGAVLRKGLMQILLRGSETEISYENVGHLE